MRRYSYYPGCSMVGTGIEYNKSLTYTNKKLGVELLEIPDWSCCGATAAHSYSKEMGEALPARNIALCEQQGLGLPLVVTCAACYSALKRALHEAQKGEAEREKLGRLIGLPIKGELEVISILEVYADPELANTFYRAVYKGLNGLKVACYYGCLYLRPAKITGEANPEGSAVMENLMRAAGAEPVDWAFAAECCGGGHHVDLPQAAKKPVYQIFRNARANGAEAIATACPLCMLNLDMREQEVNKLYGEHFDIPVYFFTELLAMAMGASPKQAGINTHYHPAEQLVAERISGSRTL